MPASSVSHAVSRQKSSETTRDKEVKYKANIGNSRAILSIVDEEVNQTRVINPVMIRDARVIKQWSRRQKQ